MARIPQTYVSSLGTHAKRRQTIAKLVRSINRATAKNRRCETVKKSKRMTKKDLEKTGVTKSRYPTRSSSLKTNYSRRFPTLSSCGTDTLAEIIMQNIESSHPSRSEAGSFRAVQGGFESVRVWERRNRQNVVWRRYRAGSEKVRKTNSVRAEEGCLRTFLLRPP